MKLLQKRNVTEVGRNIYKDKAGNMYILNQKRDSYLLLDNNDQKIFQLYRCRIVIPITIAFIIDYYSSNIVVGVIIGFVIWLIMQICYTNVFLKKLPVAEKLKEPEKMSSPLNAIKKVENKSIIRILIISIACCGLFIYNMIDLKLSLNNLLNINDINILLTTWLYIVVIISTLFTSVLCVTEMIKRRKNK